MKRGTGELAESRRDGGAVQLGLFVPGGADAASGDVRSAVKDAVAGTPERLRQSFARSFCARAIERYWQLLHAGKGRPLRRAPDTVRVLRASAQAAADALGGAAARMSSDSAAYLIGSAYAAALPDDVRAKNGVFYTPPPLVERLIANAEAAGVDWSSARVLDPACGGGAFLGPVAARMCNALRQCDRRVILRNVAARLRGLEIDGFAAWISSVFLDATLYEQLGGPRIEMAELVEVTDSLARPDPASFDLVIGNPPYGRVTLSPQQRELFKRSLYGHANMYGLFLDLAMKKARLGGIIAFVTPTSFLGGEYFKRLRGLIASEANAVTLDLVTERLGVFDGVLQETLLTVCRRGERARTPHLHFIAGDERALSCQPAGSVRLPDDPHLPWLLPRSIDDVAFAARLGALPSRLRDWGYRVSTGPLVWNRHKSQLATQLKEGAIPLIWAESVGADGTFAFRASRRNHSPYFVPGAEDAWLLVKQPCVLLQRTTSKEQSRRLICAELPASFLAKHGAVTVENHLNMLVAIGPRPPVSPATLAAFFNSAAADRSFRCLSGSVAVSAYELEAMPLPSADATNELSRALARNASRDKVEQICEALYSSADG